MGDDELRAAAERVVAAYDRMEQMLGRADIHGEPMAVAVEVCRRWLRDHPADDGEAIDEAFLRGLGFDGPSGLLSLAVGECEVTTTASSRWLIANPAESHGESVYVPAPATRSDLRRLLRALGVTPGEGGR